MAGDDFGRNRRRYPNMSGRGRRCQGRPPWMAVPARRTESRRTPTTNDLLDSGSFVSTILALSGGNSSVGRAQPCQGWGREFESRFPLQTLHQSASSQRCRLVARAEWQSGHAAACKAVYAGSIPTSASIFSRFVYIPAVPIYPAGWFLMCPRSASAGENRGNVGTSTARVAELADAADSSGSPTGKRVGEQGSNSGNP